MRTISYPNEPRLGSSLTFRDTEALDPMDIAAACPKAKEDTTGKGLSWAFL